MRQATSPAAPPTARPRRSENGKRILTVCDVFEPSKRGRAPRVPMIRMRGHWLQRLGFRNGDRIVVEERRGELVVKLAREE